MRTLTHFAAPYCSKKKLNIASTRCPALVASYHPIGRVVTTDDIVDAMLFLASGRAAFITGSALTVDRGLAA